MSYLRGRHGRRVATFMTATPIANSVAEAYTMLRYLAPADLEAAGISDFDTWAATFGQVVTDLELSPSGTGFRMKARFAKFNNVPELLRLWHQVADVKTADDLNLPTPDLKGGAPETVVVPPSQELVDFMALLAQRADAVSSRAVDPSEDNMLKISGHGRAAALDLRLVDHQPDGLAAFLTGSPPRSTRSPNVSPASTTTTPTSPSATTRSQAPCSWCSATWVRRPEQAGTPMRSSRPNSSPVAYRRRR